VPDQRASGGHNKRLNSTQDDGLKRYLSYLICIGQPATKAGICGAANRILSKYGDQGQRVSNRLATVRSGPKISGLD
jgi:hypothetical protein